MLPATSSTWTDISSIAATRSTPALRSITRLRHISSSGDVGMGSRDSRDSCWIAVLSWAKGLRYFLSGPPPPLRRPRCHRRLYLAVLPGAADQPIGLTVDSPSRGSEASPSCRWSQPPLLTL
ncbi:hypothetical protein VTN02DRAFT_6516 [Thermoascus thermophilus]